MDPNMKSKTEPTASNKDAFSVRPSKRRSDPPGIDLKIIVGQFWEAVWVKSSPHHSRGQGFFANVHPSAADVKVWVPLGASNPKNAGKRK